MLRTLRFVSRPIPTGQPRQCANLIRHQLRILQQITTSQRAACLNHSTSSTLRSIDTRIHKLFTTRSNFASDAANTINANAQQQQQKEEQQSKEEQQQQQSSSNKNSNSSSSSSSSSFNPFRYFFTLCRRAFDWYAHKLDTHPVKTQSLTSGFLFLIGDMTAQRYEEQLDRNNGIDTSDRPWIELKRLAACTSFGLFVLGPFGHHWYSRLDIYTNRLYAPRTLKNVGLKVFLDTAIFNPIFLIVFFTVVSLLEGLTMNDIGRKLYRDFVPSYAVDCSIWPPIQCVNFRFVPVKFQLLVVNLGCYFDDVFLSYVQHNGMPYIFQSIERSWLEWIGDESVKGGHGHGHGAKKVIESTEATGETPLIETLQVGTNQSTSIVKIVPIDAAHPHQPHVHPHPSSATSPLPHHHLVPKVLAETEHHISRGHGIEVQLVEELDADYTEVPVEEDEKVTEENKAESKPSQSN